MAGSSRLPRPPSTNVVSEPEVNAAYRKYFPLIREKCRRMLGDPEEAQDVAQETFVKLWKAQLQDQDPRRVTSWIYKAATRLAIDRMRRRKAAPAPVASGEDLEAGDEGGWEARTHARAELAHWASRLPAEELEVAMLSRLDRMTHPEIAEVVGVSERTVRRLLTRLEQRLADARLEVSA